MVSQLTHELCIVLGDVWSIHVWLSFRSDKVAEPQEIDSCVGLIFLLTWYRLHFHSFTYNNFLHIAPVHPRLPILPSSFQLRQSIFLWLCEVWILQLVMCTFPCCIEPLLFFSSQLWSHFKPLCIHPPVFNLSSLDVGSSLCGLSRSGGQLNDQMCWLYAG